MVDHAEIDKVLSILLKKQGKSTMLGRMSKKYDPFKVLISTILSARAKDEITEVIAQALFKKYPNVEVDSFEGLLVNYAKTQQTGLILRGVRTVADFEYELQMSFANKKLWSEIETIFIMTESRYSHISSSIIKEIAKFGGSLADMVPPNVEKKLLKK